MNKNIYHFRRYKKKEGSKNVRHPKLIVDEKENEYGYMGLTSSKKSGKHYNIPLSTNPQKGKKDKAYIRKSIDYDLKSKFSKLLDDYNLSDEDKKYIIDYVNKHKKKK